MAWLGARRAAVLLWLRTAIVESLLRTLRRAETVATVIGGLAFFAGEAEVHLFLEAVHLGDLHFHFVARQTRGDCAGRELPARFVEFVEIVRETGAVINPLIARPARPRRKPKLRTSITSAGYTGGFAIASCAFRNAYIFTSQLSRSASAEIAFGVGNVFGGFERMGM